MLLKCQREENANERIEIKMKKTKNSKNKVHIDNYREKTLLIANYFYGKSKKELTKAEVYDMWRNWFNADFKIGDKPVFKIVDNKVVYRKNPETKNEKILYARYRDILSKAYKWIKKSVENKHNSQKYFQSELDRIRKRELATLVSLAKPRGMYVILSSKNLYKNHLGYFSVIKGNKTLTSGKFYKVRDYIKKAEKEKQEGAKQNDNENTVH